MKEILMHMAKKMSSGRWLFTAAIALVFAWKSIDGTLPPDNVQNIILVGVTFYFTKKAENGG